MLIFRANIITRDTRDMVAVSGSSQFSSLGFHKIKRPGSLLFSKMHMFNFGEEFTELMILFVVKTGSVTESKKVESTISECKLFMSL